MCQLINTNLLKYIFLNVVGVAQKQNSFEDVGANVR